MKIIQPPYGQAPSALGFKRFRGGGGGFAAIFKVSVTGFTFSVIWHDKHSADWLAALASPIRLRRTSPAVRSVNRKEGPFMGRLRAYFDRLAHPMQDVHRGRINCSMLSCRDMAPWLNIHSPTTKWWEGGGASHQRGNAFPRSQGGCKGFIIRRRLLSIHRRPTTTLAPKARQTLAPLEPSAHRAVNPQAPKGLVHQIKKHRFRGAFAYIYPL